MALPATHATAVNRPPHALSLRNSTVGPNYFRCLDLMLLEEESSTHSRAGSTSTVQTSRAARKRQSVALIMPVKNEERSVGPTLDSVFASTRLPDEIIIADGQSVDRTLERLQAYTGRGVPIRIVPNPQVFAGAGRNHAATVATSDILLFLDFGNLVHPRWIEEMTRSFEEDPTVDAVGGAFEPFIESDFEHCVASIQYEEMMLFSRLSRAEKLAWIPEDLRLGGLGTAVSRACYQRLGGMPGWLRAAEDKLFGYKLLKARARIVPAVDAVLYHHIRKDLPSVFLQNFIYARGDGHIADPQPGYRQNALLYSLILAAGGYGAAYPAILPALLLVFAAHLYRAGVRPLKRVNDGVVRLCDLLHIPQLVIAKDIGAVLGYFVGLLDWIAKPQFRKLYQEYMNGSSCMQHSG
jgi:glycosyltransferase involved in cell wall biosynthesis